jgi:hypothetical protein
MGSLYSNTGRSVAMALAQAAALLAALALTPCAQAANLLISDTLENSTSVNWSAVEWDDTHYTPTTSETKYVSSSPTPQQGSYCAHYYVKIGTVEHTPLKLEFFHDEKSEVYLDWYEYYASGYDWGASQKIARIGNYDGDSATPSLEYNLAVNEEDVNFQNLCYGGTGSPCDVDRTVYSGEGMPEGSWVHFQWHVKLNTPGQSDGFAKLYKNGTLWISETNVDLRGTSSLGVNYVWVGGNYSGTNRTSNGHRFIDDIKYYDGDPGVGGSTKTVLGRGRRGRRTQ